MEKLKIRVNSEAESKEAQELFFKLGCFIDYPKKCLNDAVILFLESCGLLTYSSTETYVTDGVEYKEITLPQLRDMVVLKRNDVGDATHITTNDVWKFYIGHDTYCYERKNGVIGWHKEDSKCYGLKPIEKKEMKEFLVNHNGKWTLQLLDADTEENSFRVAVPSGAEIAILGSCANLYFWKSHFFTGGVHKNWVDMKEGYDADWYLKDADGSILVWQRPRQPEELPFIDDEPKSLNDTYAEIEQVRHNHYFKDVSDIDQMDVYEVLKRFEVTDPCLQHIVKKALCAGKRGHKDFKKDLQDILDTAVRAVDINK